MKKLLLITAGILLFSLFSFAQNSGGLIATGFIDIDDPLFYTNPAGTSNIMNLNVTGQVKITGGSLGNGKVLTSDIDGVASWQNLPTVDGSETKVTAGTNVSVTGTGTTGNPYVINSTGGLLAFAEFYALMPGDNAATVLPGAPVDFPQDGPIGGTITRLTSNTFQLSDIGTYMVSWQVSINEPGQLALELDGFEIPYTVVGRATGTSQITGNSLITTTTANSILSVISSSGNFAALTVTPFAGGTNPVSASLVITRIQ